MTIEKKSDSYSRPSIILHWLTVLVIAAVP